jgi:threonine dehydratase
MWQGASALKTAGARALGATVDLDATDPTDAFARLDRLVEDTGRTVIHPFDDPQVAAGQGTVALELLHDVPDADVVVVPVGGGGLLAGMATALAARRPGCRVVAVEPETSTALGSALHAGEPVPVAPRSIADGLNAPFAGRIALTVAQRLGVEHVTVTEEEIREGMRFLYGRAKLACEPAGAAATAALQAGKVDVGGASAVVAVVSGGNVDPEVASAILATR